MLYVGGYPGIHNKTNISTLYTFVNGQKEYFWQNYNVITDKVINDKWDWNEARTMCGDSYGIVGSYNTGYTYNNIVFYLPNRILGETPSYVTYTSQDDQGNNISYTTCGDGQAYSRTSINVNSSYTTIDDIISGGTEVTLIGDGNPHIIYYFWPDIRVNQRVKLHEYNSFFLELYNNYSDANNYTVCWMKKGAILQKKIDSSHWDHYYMPYNDLTQCITLSDIDSSICVLTNTSFGGAIQDTPAGEVAYSMDQRKVIYMEGSRVLGVYNILDGTSGYYVTLCGRYAYTIKSRTVYCHDMITDEQVSYSGFSGDSGLYSYISHYHPEAGFYFSSQATSCRITKFNGMDEPTYINNPFGMYQLAGIRLNRFRDGKYRYSKLKANTDSSVYKLEYLDESWVLHSYDTNLSYDSNITSTTLLPTKYGCWIYNINRSSDKHFYYSWDNGATWSLIV